jgi:hypothetical protein
MTDGAGDLPREVNQRHGTDFTLRREFRGAVNSGALFQS